MTVRSMPPLSLRASFRPSSTDETKRTVELVWTTGARVLRGFWERYWEELSLDPKHVRLDRLNNGAPFLRDHGDASFFGSGPTTDHVLGVVESARIVNGEGVAVVRFAKADDDPNADRIFRKIKDGIIQNVSVGYRVHKIEKIEESVDEIPVMRAVDWEPYEISAVAMGADDGAGFRGAANEQTNPCEVITRGEAPHEEKTMPEEVKPAAPTAQDEALRLAEVKAAADERARVMEIQRIVRGAKLPDAIAEKLVKEGTDLNGARVLVLDELSKRTQENPTDSHLRIGAGEDERDKRARGVTALVIQRTGAAETIRQAQESKRFGHLFKDVALDPGEFRGMTLLDLARDVLGRAGVKTSGMERMEIARRALTLRSGGNQTISDFSVLFENALHKMMLGAYATAPDTWRLWCATDTVSDFRDHLRYRNGSFGVADELPESAEYKRKAIPDGQKVAINTKTYGNKIGLSRQAIINDDMGSFTDLATRFGRMFGLTLEVNAYALLTANSGLGVTFNGQPFFHSQNSNINTTGSALSIAGIEADRHVLARQKDISANEYLDLRPAVLIVSTELGGTARTINEMEFDDTDNKYHKPNRVRGLFRTVVDTPRLTGNRRYMLADAGTYPAFKMVFLEGGETPVLESQESWDIDGTEWKVRFDAKAMPFDPKVAVTNAGQ